MTLTTRLIVLTVVLVMSAAARPTVGAHGSAGPAMTAAAIAERTLVGAWYTRVRPRNCETGEVAAIPGLRGLFTFHEGGTMSEYGVPPGSSPAMRSPGHGVWRREPGWQQYTFSFTFYRYDAAGVYIGRQKVAGHLELDATGDATTSTSFIEGFDAADNLTMTACGHAVGSRFE